MWEKILDQNIIIYAYSQALKHEYLKMFPLLFIVETKRFWL